jgi:hypothetical protein
MPITKNPHRRFEISATIVTILLASGPTWSFVLGWLILGPVEFWHKFAMFLLGLGMLAIQMVTAGIGYFVLTQIIWFGKGSTDNSSSLDDAWA